jgi:HlyD family secretion protein
MNGILAWFAGLLALIPGLGGTPAPGFTGYVEAKYVYVSPLSAGQIETLAIKEGQTVKKGDLLFAQTHSQQDALLDAANAQADAAKATWQNLTTGGRAEELAASRAAVTKAQADLKLAQTTLQRSQTLFSQNVITQAQLDQNKSDVESAQAAETQAEAQLAVTGLAARDEQQKAAEANLKAALANAEKAKMDLLDRATYAPADGRIERTYYDQGEVVAAGAPVLSLLPANALKVEFYVDEPDRTKLSMGQTVAVSCDGCAAGLNATVSFLASDPQYTAPIIYSRDERAQLVFLAEATLNYPDNVLDAGNILPGQPVSVSLSK